MMSLDKSGEEGQDDFDETIHMVQGTKSEKTKRVTKKQDKDDSIQPEKGDKHKK